MFAHSLSRSDAAEGSKQRVDVAGDSVTATRGHPFWVDDQGHWVDADELEPGDRLPLADGSTAGVTAVEDRLDVLRVYNLTVEGIHTFYVSVRHETMLVHNSDGVIQVGDEYGIIGRVLRQRGSSFTG